jgi:hypothetical protein
LFVGAMRNAQVKSLLAACELTSSSRESALVVFVAPPGTGKTRIIQEFYRELAAVQPDPPYWPRSLVDEEHDGGLGLRELTAARKTSPLPGQLRSPNWRRDSVALDRPGRGDAQRRVACARV